MNSLELAKSRSDLLASDIDLLVAAVRERNNLEGNIVELGAWKCGSTIALALGTGKLVFSFDTFGGLPYGEGQGGFEKFGNTDFAEICSTVEQFTNIILMRGKHEDTVPKFGPQKLSVIFMDSDFYSSHKVGLARLWPMLVPGGIIIFHDWKFHDVQKAIAEEIPEHERSFSGHLPDSNMGAIIKGFRQ